MAPLNMALATRSMDISSDQRQPNLKSRFFVKFLDSDFCQSYFSHSIVGKSVGALARPE